MGIIQPAHTVKILRIQQPDPVDPRDDRGVTGKGKGKGRGADKQFFPVS